MRPKLITGNGTETHSNSMISILYLLPTSKGNIDIFVMLKHLVFPAEFYSCQGGNTSKTAVWLLWDTQTESYFESWWGTDGDSPSTLTSRETLGWISPFNKEKMETFEKKWKQKNSHIISAVDNSECTISNIHLSKGSATASGRAEINTQQYKGEKCNPWMVYHYP